MSAFIQQARTPPLGIVTLSRAERHNSLVPELLAELTEAVETLSRSDDIRVLILRAEGGSFSTGGDLQGFLDHWDSDIERYAGSVVGELNRAMLALRSSPVPVVTAVQGWVTGGSLGLLLASDLVVVADSARLAPFYCEVGFAPDGGWSVILPDTVGTHRAMAAQLRNEVWNADQLVALGLASQCVPAEDLDDAAHSQATRIAGMHATTLQATKANRQACNDWRERLETERQRFVETIQRSGVREGVQAFVERTASQRSAGTGSE